MKAVCSDWHKIVLVTAAIASLGGCGSDSDSNAPAAAGGALALPTVSFVAQGESLDLANYTLMHRYDLPVGTGSNKLTAEASAVTYNKSTGTLFLVGDHGTSVVQVGRDGAFIDSMTLPADAGQPQGTAIYDPEGIAWLEGNTFVLSEERDRKATRISYTANTTASAATFKSVTLGSFSPNLGNEGLTYDPVSGGFIFVKEKTPQGIFLSTINFDAGTASNGSATTEPTNLFDPAGLGATDLADVYALSNVLSTTATDRNHLVILSHESGMLYKTDRSGNVLSRLDIGIAPQHEGVAVDENKVIYVANELGGGASKPQLWVYEPTISNTTVGVGSNVYLTFAQAIAAGTGNITLSGGGDMRTIAITDATQVKITGNTLVINPTTDLQPGISYTVQAPAGIVRAAAGSSSSPAVSSTFSTRLEAVAPTLSNTVPASSAIGVTSSHIVFTFNEPVKAGTGNVVITGSGGDTRTIAITDSSQVSISGNTVDVNPLTDLVLGTNYSVEIAAGVVTDIAGNAFAGLTGSNALKFTMAPAVGTSTPTTLDAGDVLFVAANADAVDALAFVILKDVTAGTKIHFTDKDYSAASPTSWPTNEAAFTWTADVDYPAGTLVTIQVDNAVLPTNKGVTTGTSGGISTSAETYYAFQGTITNAAAGQITVDRFLAAINLGNAAGDIPAALTTAGSYIHFTEDNVKYAGSLDRSNLPSFAALVKDVANWDKNDATAFPVIDNSLFGGTHLDAGDVLFLGANSSTPDALAFVILKDVVAGTLIHFTDKDYVVGAAWPTNESGWTWMADTAYAAGTIVNIRPDQVPLTPSVGKAFGKDGGVGGSETYYAFQGDIINATTGKLLVDRFIATIHVGSAVSGAIPSGLGGADLGFTQSNAKYTGSLDMSDLTVFKGRVKDTANWTQQAGAFALTDSKLFP